MASKFTDHEAAIEEAEWIRENENVTAIILSERTGYLVVATEVEYKIDPFLRDLRIIEIFRPV